VKPLQDMIKKNVEFKWGPRKKEYFDKIKTKLSQTLTLLSRDFTRGFILYTFASYIAFTFILTHKKQGDEFSVAFMSLGLQGAELNYPDVEK
jgi:hypothetical protein